MLHRAITCSVFAVAGLSCLAVGSGCHSAIASQRQALPVVYQPQYDKLVDQFEVVNFRLNGKKIFEGCPPDPHKPLGVDPGTGADALGFDATRMDGNKLSGYLCNNTVILN